MKNAFEYEAELAALREELDALKNHCADLDGVNRIIKKARDAAEQRNADAVAKLELCESVMDNDSRGQNIARALRCVIEDLKPTESGASE
jgi:hypothetical protein